MADRKIEFEKDGPDDVVRVDGTIIGRLTGQGGNRQMQWREGQDLDQDKVVGFDKAFAATDRSTRSAEEALRRSGLV